MYTVYEASGTLGTEYPDYRVEADDYPVNWMVIKRGFATRQQEWDWVNRNLK